MKRRLKVFGDDIEIFFASLRLVECFSTLSSFQLFLFLSLFESSSSPDRPFLKPRMASPIDLPSWGNFDGPIKINRMIKIKIKCVMLKPMVFSFGLNCSVFHYDVRRANL